MLMRSIDNATQTKCKYKDFAISMIKADKSLNNSDNYEEMKNIFLERKLITSSDLNNIKNFPLKGLEIKEDLKDPGTYEKFINDNAKVFDLTEDTPLRTASISFNEDGNITVGVIMTKEIQLKGSEFGKYENCWVDVHGGVTLILDKNGKLLDIINDRIDEKKIKDVMNGLNNSIKKDLILEPFKSYFKDENTMYEGICDHLADGRKKIYRLPVIFN